MNFLKKASEAAGSAAAAASAKAKELDKEYGVSDKANAAAAAAKAKASEVDKNLGISEKAGAASAAVKAKASEIDQEYHFSDKAGAAGAAAKAKASEVDQKFGISDKAGAAAAAAAAQAAAIDGKLGISEKTAAASAAASAVANELAASANAGAVLGGKEVLGTMYVGAYTRTLPFVASATPGKGITMVKVATDGTMLDLGVVFEAENPSYLALDAAGTTLFSTVEKYNSEELNPGLPPSLIEVWTVEQETGALGKVASLDANGFACCHLVCPAGGGAVIGVNYETGNVVSVGCQPDGEYVVVSKPADHATLGTFPGANPGRQEGPHAHMACISPTNPGRLYIPDLGSNCVVQYSIGQTTELALGEHRRLGGELTLVGSTGEFQAGAGPRHMCFHPTLPVAYVVTELHSTVCAFSVDPASGGLLPLQANVSTLPADFPGKEADGTYDANKDDAISCAAIRIHPNGNWLYASNRGHDSIASFAIAADGTLTQTAVTKTDPEGVEGDPPAHPRDFTLMGDGLLIAANQNTSRLASFALDPETGVPIYTGNSLTSPTPVAVLPRPQSFAASDPEPESEPAPYPTEP